MFLVRLSIPHVRLESEATMQTDTAIMDEGWKAEIISMRIYDTGTFYLQFFAVGLVEDIERFDAYREDYFNTIITGTP